MFVQKNLIGFATTSRVPVPGSVVYNLPSDSDEKVYEGLFVAHQDVY
jgi:hypothetical protein